MKPYIKKFMGGWAIITLLFIIAYFGIKFFGGDISISDGENRKYIIWFYITTLLWFGLKIKDNKLSQAVREGVLIIIFLVIGSFFSSSVGFGGLLGTVITLILIILIYITKIKNTFLRNLLSGVFGGIFLLMLISNFVPIYSEAPNLDGFYITQSDEVIIPGSTIKGNIQINSGSYNITNQEQNIPYIFDNTTKIVFSAESSGAVIYIKNKQGSIIEIPGQSINELKKENTTIIIKSNHSLCKVFVSEGDTMLYTGDIVFINNISFGKIYRDRFIKERKAFFEKDLGGSFVFQPTIRKLSWGIITLLYTIDPINFGENSSNYNAYGSILELTTETPTVRKEENRDIQETLRQRIKQSSEKTRFKFLNSF